MSDIEQNSNHKKFKPRKVKFDPNVEHSFKTDSKTIFTSEGGIINSLRFVYVTAIIVALYRTWILVMFSDHGELISVINHGMMIAVMIGIAAWCKLYGYYRDMYKSKKINFFSEYSFMKVVSFIVGLLCLGRMVTTIIYFLSMEYMNVLTTVYVLTELLLWLGLSVFFFCFWKNRSKRVHKMEVKDDSFKI